MAQRKPLKVDDIKKVLNKYHEEGKGILRKRNKTSARVIQGLEDQFIKKLSKNEDTLNDEKLFEYTTILLEAKPEKGKESERTFDELKNNLERVEQNYNPSKN